VLPALLPKHSAPNVRVCTQPDTPSDSSRERSSSGERRGDDGDGDGDQTWQNGNGATEASTGRPTAVQGGRLARELVETERVLLSARCVRVRVF